MGMLFNTPGTSRILSLLNENFRRSQFDKIKNYPPGGSLANFVNALNGLTGNTGAGGIYAQICSAASPYTLRLDDWDVGVSGNWSTFLGILDSAASSPFTNTATNPAPANPTISGEIGRAIAAALQNQDPWKGVKAVEFFAVPSPIDSSTGKNVVVPTLNILLFTDKAPEKTMIITITTSTYDQAKSHLVKKK